MAVDCERAKIRAVFLLIRHGSVDYNAYPGRFRGHGIDLLPLTSLGIGEAEDLACHLEASGGIDAIVSSPMTRALHTAMIVSRRLDLAVDVELDLHEWVPDLSQQWSDGEVPLAAYRDLVDCGGEWPPGEERLWEPHSRVRDRVGRVLRAYADFEKVVVVCHSGVIEAMTGKSHTAPCQIVPLTSL